jgi:hypothetical protein
MARKNTEARREKEKGESTADSGAHPVLYVGGGKGGVGKSLMAMATVDFLLAAKKKVHLVETDTSAPDVYKTYKDECESTQVNLTEKEGWMELGNLIGSTPASTFVVNTAAANHMGVRDFGTILSRVVQGMKRRLIVLWMIDRKRESMELLTHFLESIPEAELHVVRNMYLGTEKKFELYNTSKLKTSIEAKGGKSLNFSDLADRVTDVMNRERWTIEQAIGKLPFGDRVELERWRDECKVMLREVIGG